MPTARAISSIGASCMPRSSNSARVAVTSSRSRICRVGVRCATRGRIGRERPCDRCSHCELPSAAVAERGATPKVSATRKRVLKAASVLFTPLLPDDYLELINPLWSTRELRGRVERIEPETEDAVTILIRPGWEWEGHEPGQYLRVGFVVDGVHHWRAYSLTSDPGRPDGF